MPCTATILPRAIFVLPLLICLPGLEEDPATSLPTYLAT